MDGTYCPVSDAEPRPEVLEFRRGTNDIGYEGRREQLGLTPLRPSLDGLRSGWNSFKTSRKAWSRNLRGTKSHRPTGSKCLITTFHNYYQRYNARSTL